MARRAPSIDAYGEGGFRLSGERHEGSVLIVGDAARPWDVTGPADLTLAALALFVPMILRARGRGAVLSQMAADSD